MSNYWVGKDFICKERYGSEIDMKFPNIQYTVPYTNSLYAFVTMDYNGADIKGTTGSYAGKSPEELDIYSDAYFRDFLDEKVSASIKDRYIPFK